MSPRSARFLGVVLGLFLAADGFIALSGLWPVEAQQGCMGALCPGGGTVTLGTSTLIDGTIPNGSFLINNGGFLGPASLGAGCATFLATPSSANLRACVTDESGTGALIFASGAIGDATATSIVVTNASSVPAIVDNGAGANDILDIKDNGTVGAGFGDGAVLWVGGTSCGAANSVCIGEVAGQITFEGATADAFEIRVAAADPTVGDQTWTIPNAAGAVSRTFMSLEATQTVAGALTLSTNLTMNGSNNTVASNSSLILGTNMGRILGQASFETPDTAMFLTGNLSNSINIAENDDIVTSNFDFNNGRCGTSACTDPAVVGHSHNQATNQYWQLSSDGTLAHLDGQSGTNGTGQFAWSGAKDLTESSATVVVDIPVASGAMTGATINWSVVAEDGTDKQSRRGASYLAVVNKAGTETCTVADIGTPQVAVSAGTLTVTTAGDTTGTNVCTLTINAVSSLTQTILRAYYSVIVDGPGIPAAR